MNNIKYIVGSNVFRLSLNHLQGASGAPKKPAALEYCKFCAGGSLKMV
jgi:hypothetical protein